MSAVDGQQRLDGTEDVDKRVEAAGKALWWRDARRAWGRDGQTEAGEGVARVKAREIWPRVRSSYVEAARLALDAADKA